MAVLLNCEALTKYFGTRLLFSGISLGIFEGERVGMIGPNGSGKSTLLGYWRGTETADAGEVSARRHSGLSTCRRKTSARSTTVEAALLSDALAGEHLDEHERAAR